jgi:hypothetical protein
MLHEMSTPYTVLVGDAIRRPSVPGPHATSRTIPLSAAIMAPTLPMSCSKEGALPPPKILRITERG